MSIFSLPVTVFYEDTDCGGVVYHANYAKYYERARSAWLMSMGESQQAGLKNGEVFVVADLSVQYKKAAVFEDALLINIDAVDIKGARIIFKQSIVREMTNELLSTATVTVVHLNFEDSVTTGKVKAVPESWKRKLKA